MYKTFFNSKFKFLSHISSGMTIGSLNSTNIGNYFINYPEYQKSLKSQHQEKFKLEEKSQINNFLLVDKRYKEIAEQTNWKLISDSGNNTSSIEKVFLFNEEKYALEFISLMKDKCDEIDHHPSWTFNSNNSTKTYSINVNLTSHFAKNNVTEKDYEMAAYMSYEYEKLMSLYKDSKFRTMISLSSTVLFFLFIFSYGFSKYNKEKKRYNCLDFRFNSEFRNFSR